MSGMVSASFSVMVRMYHSVEIRLGLGLVCVYSRFVLKCICKCK